LSLFVAADAGCAESVALLGELRPIPFPEDDEPRRAAADFLRNGQRLLGGNELDSAMQQVRKALGTMKNTSGWGWPGRKDKGS
jgi:hypothetical protein